MYLNEQYKQNIMVIFMLCAITFNTINKINFYCYRQCVVKKIRENI
jgi:hypothetical protein